MTVHVGLCLNFFFTDGTRIARPSPRNLIIDVRELHVTSLRCVDYGETGVLTRRDRGGREVVSGNNAGYGSVSSLGEGFPL